MLYEVKGARICKHGCELRWFSGEVWHIAKTIVATTTTAIIIVMIIIAMVMW